MDMKRLMRIHRYLSCCVAPAMLFFAASGAWQAFRLHDSKKDGSYTAPAALHALSEMHMAERLSGAAAGWFRAAQVLLAAMFAATAIIGVVMAFRVAPRARTVWACLTVGAAIPVLLALWDRGG